MGVGVGVGGKGRVTMNSTKRSLLLLTALVAALFFASGVALAATYNGDSGDNKLTGTSDADVMHGFGGDDLMRGLAGRDKMYGGDGFDRIYAGRGNDFISTVGDGTGEASE